MNPKHCKKLYEIEDLVLKKMATVQHTRLYESPEIQIWKQNDKIINEVVKLSEQMGPSEYTFGDEKSKDSVIDTGVISEAP